MTTMRSRQRGVSTVFWTVSMAGVLGLGTLAWDMNNLFVATAELQSAVDAGALEGAANLYWNPDDPASSGTVIRRVETAAAARAAVRDNLARGSAPDSVTVEIGHWRFDPAGGGRFTADITGTIIPPDLSGKVLDGSGGADDLNDPASGEINAVRVTASRQTTPVQALVGGFLGFSDYDAARSAVAYVGYAGSLDAGEVNMPIAICQAAITNPDNSYSCGAGRFIPTTLETGGWSSFNQVNACQGGTNAKELTDIIDYGTGEDNCIGGADADIVFGLDVATVGGQVNSAFQDLHACWLEKTGGTEPWPMVLPVIKCDGQNPGPCNKVVGSVAVNILWVLQKENDIANDAPRQMDYPTEGGGTWYATPAADLEMSDPSREYGIARWNEFVEEFNILGLDVDGDGSPDPAYHPEGFKAKTIYFDSDCDPQIPRGTTAARNFGVRARVPVLVGGGDDV